MASPPARALSPSANPCQRAAAPIASENPISSAAVYVPEEDANYREEGLASWYGDDFHGRLTANGEVFDMGSLTAAHPTLPMPCYARVTNLSNGRSLIVRVNDRGPYHGNRLIDVSNKAAELLEFKGNGVARVRVEYVGRAPLEGSDDRQLIDPAHRRAGAIAIHGPGCVGRAFVPEMPSSNRAIRATCRCRRAAPTASAIRRRTRPRSTRPPRCLPLRDLVRAGASSKIPAPCPMKTTIVMRRWPPTLRSIRAGQANCWPARALLASRSPAPLFSKKQLRRR